jgi:hypothetical protein
MAKQRPTGVTILAILAIIGGILGVIGGLLGLLGGALIASTGVGATHPGAAGLLVVLAIVTLVLGVLDIISGIGFWRLAPWAWMLGVVLQVVSLIEAVVYITQGNVSGEIIPIVISLVVLWYLFRPNVQQAFGRA